jgi:hypothetical protein
MTEFFTSAAVEESHAHALEAAVATCIYNGFELVQRDAISAVLTGPGMYSTHQNALLGATKVTLQLRDHALEAAAELGGVDFMRRFLMRFPFLLGLGLGLLFAVVGGLHFGRQNGIGFGVPWAPGWRWLVVAFGGAMLPVTPWLVLSPLMSRMILKRTQRALEVLVRNAVRWAAPTPDNAR